MDGMGKIMFREVIGFMYISAALVGNLLGSPQHLWLFFETP